MSVREDTVVALQKAAEAANDAKAADIVAIDVSEPVAITDAFLLATASSPRQVLAVAEEVEKKLREDLGLHPRSREGLLEAQWTLLDYDDFVVHIFNEEAREFYGLEKLWGDCPHIELHLEHPETTRKADADE